MVLLIVILTLSLAAILLIIYAYKLGFAMGKANGIKETTDMLSTELEIRLAMDEKVRSHAVIN